MFSHTWPGSFGVTPTRGGLHRRGHCGLDEFCRLLILLSLLILFELPEVSSRLRKRGAHHKDTKAPIFRKDWFAYGFPVYSGVDRTWTMRIEGSVAAVCATNWTFTSATPPTERAEREG